MTQSCQKIPVQIQRKLPDEKCEEIPDIVCHLELESYEEPVCEMVPVEECEDVYKEIPFLVDDEECEDIPRLECTEVSNNILFAFPVEKKTTNLLCQLCCFNNNFVDCTNNVWLDIIGTAFMWSFSV